MHLRELLVGCGALPPLDRTVVLFEAWLRRTLPDHSSAARRLLSGFATWHHLRRMRIAAAAGAQAGRRQHGPPRDHRRRAVPHPPRDPRRRVPQRPAGPPRRLARRRAQHPLHRPHLRRLGRPEPAPARPALPPPDRPRHPGPRPAAAPRPARPRPPRRPPPAGDLPARRRPAAALRPAAHPHQPAPPRRRPDHRRHRHAPTPPPSFLHRSPSSSPSTYAPGPTPNRRERSPWLFPGYRPGQPLHASYLSRRVRDAGVPLLPGRNSALRQLVLDMPPAVAARSLGYSPTVAEAHARNAGATWASYARRPD